MGDDQNLVERFGDSSIGLDPSDILVDPSLLLPPDSAECPIGRCDCGVIGYGDVRVRIELDQHVIRWSAIHGPRTPVCFAIESYRDEVRRALSDRTWETPERTAARVVSEQVDREALARLGLEFSWASGRVEEGVMTVALWLRPGPYQLLVHSPWFQSAGPAVNAAAVVDTLSRSPSSWGNVVWLPQAEGLTRPSIAGFGWRRC
jgi:hypothetical protein